MEGPRTVATHRPLHRRVETPVLPEPPSPSPALLDLPQEVFELILRHATASSEGEVSFSYWPLTSVCTRFRDTIYSLIRRVSLITVDDYRLSSASTKSFLDIASAVMSGPLQRCRNLQHLSLDGCDALTDKQVGRFLRTCPPLRSFEAVICMHQTDVIIDDLSRRAAKHLRVLNLIGCDRMRHGSLFPCNFEAQPFHPCSALSDLSLIHVGERCSQLRSITLSKALSITDLGLRALGTLPRLEEVKLRRLTGITNEGISYLADGNGNIKRFSLLSCGTISDAGLIAVAHGRATRHLELVAVSFNHGLTDVGVRALATNLPFLEELECDHCASLKETWCADLYDNVSPLRRLSFRGVNLEITSRGISNLTRIANLESLNLTYVGTIDAELLLLLRESAPKLQTLILEACSKVDDDAAQVLADFTSLRALDVSWCSSLTSAGVHTIATGPLGKSIRKLCIGPVNGPRKEEVLYTVGKECENLETLVLNGDVDENFIDWLRMNTGVKIEYAEAILRPSKRRTHSNPASPVGVSLSPSAV